MQRFADYIVQIEIDSLWSGRKHIRWNLDHQDWIADVTSGDYQKYYEEMYARR